MQLLDRHSSTTLTGRKVRPRSESTVATTVTARPDAPRERLQPVHGLDAVAVQVDLRHRVVAVVAEGLAGYETSQLSRPRERTIERPTAAAGAQCRRRSARRRSRGSRPPTRLDRRGRRRRHRRPCPSGTALCSNWRIPTDSTNYYNRHFVSIVGTFWSTRCAS